MIRIRNIKVSVKIKHLSLDNAIEVLTCNKIKFTKYQNFLTFHNKFTYIFFKSGDGVLNHINITKIKTVKHIKRAVKKLKKLFKCVIKKVILDNIIATFDLKREINLCKILKVKLFKNIKYNIEQFPGLFVKFDTGTVILFHSGKSVLVGFKKKSDLKCVARLLIASMAKL